MIPVRELGKQTDLSQQGSWILTINILLGPRASRPHQANTFTQLTVETGSRDRVAFYAGGRDARGPSKMSSVRKLGTLLDSRHPR